MPGSPCCNTPAQALTDLRNVETIIDRLKQLAGLAEMGITPAPSSVLPSPTLGPDR